MTRVVVVGGGIAGLAAALDLATAGREVTLLEATAAVGGKLRLGEVAGLPVDEGAESFLRRAPEGLALVERLGLADRVVAPAEVGAAVWARGRLRPLPSGTVLGIPARVGPLSGVLAPGEVLRAAADRWLPGEAPGDDVAVGAWVRRRLGRAVVDRLVDPLLGGVYAGRADELSLAATVPALPRDERSALRAARRSLGASGTAAGPVFGGLPDGMGSLPEVVRAAVVAAGGDVLTHTTVRRIERSERGWRVVHGPTTDERVIDAAAVVLAVPPAPAARLLADAVPAAAAELARIETASVAVITTAWRRDDASPLALSGYLVPATAGRPVKAVTLSSRKWPHLAGRELVTARCSIGRHGDVTDLQHDDGDLVARAVAELTAYAGFRGRPVGSLVSRWGGGLPQYAVGHRDRVERIRAAVAAAGGLAVCGAAYDGVGIPACIRTGQQAAAAVR